MSEQVMNVKSCTHGSTTLSGILSFSYTRSGTSVGNRADDEVYHTAKSVPNVDVSGNLTGIDITSFDGVNIGTEETLTVVGTTVGSKKDVTIAVSKCIITGDSGGVNHASQGAVTMDWECSSTDGSTDPISIVVAT